MIREPVSDARPVAQVGSHVASSSWPKVGWQTTFKLGNEPLPVIASVRTWAQGEGGQVDQSLPGAADEEDTPRVRELVRKTNTYVELVDLEVTSNLNVVLSDPQPAEDIPSQQLPTDQPTGDAPAQPAEDAPLSHSANSIDQV
nr:hypothetical protein CFP56_17310 [Quercus suber]